MAQGFSVYSNKQSYLHRLNPSLKLIILVFLIIMIFLPTGFFGQTIIFVLLISLWIISKLSWRSMKSIIKSCVGMFIILFFINWLAYKGPGFANVSNVSQIFNFNFFNWKDVTDSTSGNTYQVAYGYIFGGSVGTPYIHSIDSGWAPATSHYVRLIVDNHNALFLEYQSTWYSLSTQVVFYAFYITIKIFLMITVVTLLMSTTNPVQLSFAIEDILSPLRYLKVPVNEWAMTISIALRFVPSLLDESQRIMKAQASRGVDFKNGNFKNKVKSLVSLVVPMFSIAFHKADDLANAMEARSYNPRYLRTRYRTYGINKWDWILFVFIGILLGFFIIFAVNKMLFSPYGWPEAVIMYGGK